MIGLKLTQYDLKCRTYLLFEYPWHNKSQTITFREQQHFENNRNFGEKITLMSTNEMLPLRVQKIKCSTYVIAI